jgi:hypothetical protein
MKEPVAVSEPSPVAICSLSLAMPKSTILAWRRPMWVRVRMMFEGFKSRWMIPPWCAASTPFAHLPCDLDGVGEGEWGSAPEVLAERQALHQLHDTK